MHYPDCDGDGDILKGDTGVQGSSRERDKKEKEKRRNTVLGNIKMEAKAKKNTLLQYKVEKETGVYTFMYDIATDDAISRSCFKHASLHSL